jgi:hypothetical protein
VTRLHAGALVGLALLGGASLRDSRVPPRRVVEPVVPSTRRTPAGATDPLARSDPRAARTRLEAVVPNASAFEGISRGRVRVSLH